MQSLTAPDHEPTPMSSSTPLESLKLPDPLVAQAAKRIADVINDFKRELDLRDGTWANAHGQLELALEWETYTLTIVPDKDSNEYPVTVQSKLETEERAMNGFVPSPPINQSSAYRHARCDSDVELERHLVSRKKRKVDKDSGAHSKRQRTDYDSLDIMPLVTSKHLDNVLSKLREDIQEDTSECVNYVQRLLRRSKQEWHEQNGFEYEHLQTQNPRPHGSVINGTNPSASFPSPNLDCDDPATSIPDVVRREVNLLSSQIKWVEDCRRVASDMHEKREETWRTSSAGFHDRQRQDRENFQNIILHESGLHGQTLHQILNEVKAIGLYAQSMKWETPATHLTHPSPSVSTPPAFPTQPQARPVFAPARSNSAGLGIDRK